MKQLPFKENKTAASLVLGSGASPIQMFEQPVPPDYISYLYGPIEKEEDYVELIHTIRYGVEGQQIVIHINSPGGNLNVCLAIINAINNTDATVITIIDGEAASAAAFIWLAGHTRIISSNHVMLMLHTAATSFFGSKLPEIKNSVDVCVKIIESLMDELVDGFLTDEEREDIRRGMDLFFTGKEIADRIKQIQEAAKKTAETADEVKETNKLEIIGPVDDN